MAEVDGFHAQNGVVSGEDRGQTISAWHPETRKLIEVVAIIWSLSSSYIPNSPLLLAAGLKDLELVPIQYLLSNVHNVQRGKLPKTA